MVPHDNHVALHVRPQHGSAAGLPRRQGGRSRVAVVVVPAAPRSLLPERAPTARAAGAVAPSHGAGPDHVRREVSGVSHQVGLPNRLQVPSQQITARHAVVFDADKRGHAVVVGLGVLPDSPAGSEDRPRRPTHSTRSPVDRDYNPCSMPGQHPRRLGVGVRWLGQAGHHGSDRTGGVQGRLEPSAVVPMKVTEDHRVERFDATAVDAGPRRRWVRPGVDQHRRRRPAADERGITLSDVAEHGLPILR